MKPIQAASERDQEVSGVRRRLLAAAAGAMPIGAFGMALPSDGRSGSPVIPDRRDLMGTQVDLVVEAGPATTGAVRDAIDHAWMTMGNMAARLSRFDADSDVSRINARGFGHGGVVVSEFTFALLQRALDLGRRTAGAFDITVGTITAVREPAARHDQSAGFDADAIPDDNELARLLPHLSMRAVQLDSATRRVHLTDALTRIDLGGFAKLPILEAGLAVLRDARIGGALVNGGGDVLVSPRHDGVAWRIGIRDALTPSRLVGVVPMHGGVVASSGDYERFVWSRGERFHHIIDPSTGRPSQGLHGVTLVGETVAQVNGWGTAAMVTGPRRAWRMLESAGIDRFVLMPGAGPRQTSPSLAHELQPAVSI